MEYSLVIFDKYPPNFPRKITNQHHNGSVAKNILTTFYSGNELALATIPCGVTEFLQQSRLSRYRDRDIDMAAPFITSTR
jgi:hypothetical protein